MSIRAREAYDSGEKPWSKWTKDDILDSFDEPLRSLLAKFSCKILKANCLRKSSWHHTGNYCNRTSFYCVLDADQINVDDFTNFKKKPRQKAIIKEHYAVAKYNDWSGSRAHPHCEEKKAVIHWTDKNGQPSMVNFLKGGCGTKRFSSFWNVVEIAKPRKNSKIMKEIR